MDHIYPYKKKVLNCWCIHDVDRRSDWCREYCDQPFFVDMRYTEDTSIPVHHHQDPEGFVDEVVFEFKSKQDLVLFTLVWG
jgi:hypothetical protein